jgi:hypothetical protein
MGIQTATARRLAVPDLTTTTFTQLLTGTVMESAIGGERVHRSAVVYCLSRHYWPALL